MDHKKNNNRPNKRFRKPHFDRKNNSVKKVFRHHDQVTEAEVGITEFLSNLEGFTGVLKARYSDFHVCEVDPSGTVATLTNTDIPKDEERTIDYDSIENSPIENVPSNIWNDIKEIVNSDSKECIRFNVNSLTKNERKNIHSSIKKYFGFKIDTNTVEEDGNKILVFKKPSHGHKERTDWPEDRGKYVHFILYKEALDTMTACYKIADVIKIKPSNISYAGIKDKRAKTTQWLCIKQIQPFKLMSKSKPFNSIKLGNIVFKDHPLKLGDLSGNRFKIVIRNVNAEKEVIDKAMQFVSDNGFINYYGLQRFGNDKEVPTYIIGVKLLLGNWKEAIELILKPKKSDDPLSDVAQAKKIYSDTSDVGKAYNSLRRSKNNCVEAKLLQGLVKEKNNYVNALENIPRNMRLFYIHSIQSLIWNKMVSIRIQKYGLKPVVNDLVEVSNECVKSEEESSDEKVEDNEESVEIQEDQPELPKIGQQVKALAESDLSSYTINDIVLPLPGYDIEYPENMKDEYKEELEKHGLTLEMPKQSVRTYTLSGAYRKMIGRVQDMEWKIMKYNDPNKSLILSDLEKLRKMEEPTDTPDGKYKAAIVEFTLDSSSYATMVLREIMKIDTSPSAQAKMNDYACKSESTNGAGGDRLCQPLKISSENGDVINNDLIHGSMLNDKEKMEEFKRKIYGDTAKRKSETEEQAESPKKQKVQ